MASGILQIVIFLVVLLALAKPLGAYMARVYDGSRRSSTASAARRAAHLPRCGVRPTTA
jgi:K+-transporting ATPase A subunit